MQFDFTGKRVVVGGGSRGIGRSIALGFAEHGADISICARGAEALAATKAEIARLGHKTHAAQCDVADSAAVARYIAEAAAALGGIDVLVNNASALARGDDEASWESSLDIDLLAPVRASRAAQPFLEQSRGSIVNIASISGYRPSKRTPAYGTVKAALMYYTGVQAGLLGRKGIRVNCIAPGSIEFSGGTWERRKTEDPGLYQAVHKSILFGRLGRPEEVANVVLFLASPLGGWVTGQTIAVDGGQMLGG
ncbi:MAG: SDR family oxidoreductase [Proteobacteria bacterium]|nr:SDR family oxidoreductase [Pseudomonadota bacterium]